MAELEGAVSEFCDGKLLRLTAMKIVSFFYAEEYQIQTTKRAFLTSQRKGSPKSKSPERSIR